MKILTHKLGSGVLDFATNVFCDECYGKITTVNFTKGKRSCANRVNRFDTDLIEKKVRTVLRDSNVTRCPHCSKPIK